MVGKCDINAANKLVDSFPRSSPLQCRENFVIVGRGSLAKPHFLLEWRGTRSPCLQNMLNYFGMDSADLKLLKMSPYVLIQGTLSQMRTQTSARMMESRARKLPMSSEVQCCRSSQARVKFVALLQWKMAVVRIFAVRDIN